jgi:hypothetical protein
MPNQVGTSQVIRFATFEVDLQAQEVRNQPSPYDPGISARGE